MPDVALDAFHLQSLIIVTFCFRSGLRQEEWYTKSGHHPNPGKVRRSQVHSCNCHGRHTGTWLHFTGFQRGFLGMCATNDIKLLPLLSFTPCRHGSCGGPGHPYIEGPLIVERFYADAPTLQDHHCCSEIISRCNYFNTEPSGLVTAQQGAADQGDN